MPGPGPELTLMRPELVCSGLESERRRRELGDPGVNTEASRLWPGLNILDKN